MLNQVAGRSQPALVRTQAVGDPLASASRAVPSTWHDNMPAPSSSNEMPTISRMANQRCPSGRREERLHLRFKGRW